MAQDRNQEDLLFREVEEELRRDRYTQLWKKYGTLIVVATNPEEDGSTVRRSRDDGTTWETV